MINEISPKQAQEWLNTDEAVLIDVRELDEFQDEYIPHSLFMPLRTVHKLIKQVDIDKDKKIIMHCQSGVRSKIAIKRMQMKNEYQNALYSLEGGILGWKKAELPVVSGILAPNGFSIFRQVQVIVGAMIALSILLGFFGMTVWFAIAGLIGAMLCFAGITGWCGLGFVLSKMPWNK